MRERNRQIVMSLLARLLCGRHRPTGVLKSTEKSTQNHDYLSHGISG